MKKIKPLLKLVVLISITLITFASCSSSSDNDNSKIEGSWGIKYNSTINLKYTFKGNKKVDYYSNNRLEETGTWKLKKDILTITFSEDVEIKFEYNIIFINEDQFTWNGDSYYRIK